MKCEERAARVDYVLVLPARTGVCSSKSPFVPRSYLVRLSIPHKDSFGKEKYSKRVRASLELLIRRY